jgi:hypothetical protein
MRLIHYLGAQRCPSPLAGPSYNQREDLGVWYSERFHLLSLVSLYRGLIVAMWYVQSQILNLIPDAPTTLADPKIQT